MNCTVVEMLRINLEKTQDWVRQLASIELVIYSIPSATTKKSPYEIVLQHKEPLEKGSAQYQFLSSEGIDALIEEYRSRLEELSSEIVDNIVTAQDRQKKYADQGRKEVIFSPGDLVIIDHAEMYPGKQEISRTKFLGPFKVIERVGVNAYRLDMPKSTRTHTVWNVSNLRKYTSAEGLAGSKSKQSLPRKVSRAEKPLEIFKENTLQKLLQVRFRGESEPRWLTPHAVKRLAGGGAALKRWRNRDKLELQN
jgi:hypothetical protein